MMKKRLSEDSGHKQIICVTTLLDQLTILSSFHYESVWEASWHIDLQMRCHTAIVD